MKIIEYKMYDFFTENESFKNFYESLKNKSLQEITQDEYKKLFWFVYDGTKLNHAKSFYQEPIFIDLSKIFFDDFISLIIESIEKSLDESNNQEITHLQQMFQVFFPLPWTEILDGFDRKSVDRLIEYFINLDFDIYQELNDINGNQYILKLLLLDKLKHYEFIKELLKYDTKNSHSYLRTLYGMSSYGKSEKEIIEDFFDIYDKLAKDKKMDFYKSLADLAEWNNKGKFFENIELKSLEMLLVDYYELFDGNTFYKDMNNDLFPKQPLTFINNLWIYLSKKEYKSFLEDKLIIHENKQLATEAKIVLDRLYNSLVRENKDYKKLFDEEYGMKDEHITVQGNIYGSVIDKSHNKTINNHYKEKNKNDKKWFEKWWVISLGISLILLGVIWFTLSSWRWGLGVGTLSFIILIAFDPKRYYRRMATASFLVTSLQLSTFKGLIVIPKNDFAHGFLSIGEHSIPWIGILFAIFTITFGILDFLENKEK